MNRIPERKRIRLDEYDYSQKGAYFITICAKDRHNLFGEISVGATVPGRPHGSHIELAEAGKCIENAITYYNANMSEVIFDKYVIMPNHIHAIVLLISTETGDRGRSPLQYVVRNLKAYVTKQIGFSPWQKSFHDHIIRSEDDYNRICKYIDDNPILWSEDCYYPKN